MPVNGTQPSFQLPQGTIFGDSMLIAAGTRLGPYEVLSALGAGGMGDVWKARDTRIGRMVAIKQLKGQHTGRFEQEARAIAALNHPHICTLHDVGPDYLVLEYVEGAPILDSGDPPGLRFMACTYTTHEIAESTPLVLARAAEHRGSCESRASSSATSARSRLPTSFLRSGARRCASSESGFLWRA